MALQAGIASLLSVPQRAGGLLSKMAERGTLPPTGVSPMKRAASPGSCGESPLLRNISSPAAPRVAPAAVACSPLKAAVAAAEEPPTPPRTPSKAGKAAPAAAAPKVKAKAKAKSAGKAAAATAAPPGEMLPPKVPGPAPKGKKRTKKALLAEQLAFAPVLESNPVRTARPQLPPKLPEDNYEMSDREESSDEIPMDVDRSSKHVPAWVETFEKKAIEQADVDPGSVFGRGVPVCDLDEIFPDSLYRKLDKTKVKRVRGSSCRWGPDRLKGTEIQAYAQKMGQRKRLSMFQRASLACRSTKAQKRLHGA